MAKSGAFSPPHPVARTGRRIPDKFVRTNDDHIARPVALRRPSRARPLKSHGIRHQDTSCTSHVQAGRPRQSEAQLMREHVSLLRGNALTRRPPATRGKSAVIQGLNITASPPAAARYSGGRPSLSAASTSAQAATSSWPPAGSWLRGLGASLSACSGLLLPQGP